MERIHRSWALIRQSYGVLRSNPSLIAFPIISSIASILIFISFALPMYFAFGQDVMETEKMPPAAYPFLFLFYVVSYFVVIFFNAGLVHCASEALSGRETSLNSGLNAAGRKVVPILGWALLSATIGVILRTISERVGIVGKLVVALIGGAWTIITFFVVPSMVLEGIGPISAIKHSAVTLKKTWGEALIGGAGIGLALGLLSLPPIVLIIFAAFLGSFPIIFITVGFAILYWLALAAIGSSLQGIYTTAVYCYANTHTVPVGFDEAAMTEAFRSNPGMIDKIRRRF